MPQQTEQASVMLIIKAERVGKKQKIFHIYIDDSGHFKSLLNFAGEVQRDPNLLPLGLVAAAVVPDAIHEDLIGSWLDLKANILGKHPSIANVPVPVHQRLMWGHDVRQHYNFNGKKPNPYYDMTPEERFYWVNETRRIVSHFCRFKDGLYSSYFVIDNYERAEIISSFFKTEESLSERRLIRARNGKLYDIYHKTVTNPLIDSYAKILFGSYRSIACRYLKNFSINLYFDRNPDAKGFEVLTAFEILKKRGHLEKLGQLVPSGWDTHPLIEVADLFAYWTHRKLHLEKVGNTDQHMKQWDLSLPLITKEAPHPSQEKDYREMQMCLVLHFELARIRMMEKDAGFTGTHVITVDEFLGALDHAIGDGTFGYPILRDSPRRVVHGHPQMTRAGITPGPSIDSISPIAALLQPHMGLLR